MAVGVSSDQYSGKSPPSVKASLLTSQAGVVTVLCGFFMRESYAPVMLERKAARLRKSTGNSEYKSKMSTGDSPRAALAKALIRPTKMFLRSPIVFIFVVSLARSYYDLKC